MKKQIFVLTFFLLASLVAKSQQDSAFFNPSTYQWETTQPDTPDVEPASYGVIGIPDSATVFTLFLQAVEDMGEIMDTEMPWDTTYTVGDDTISELQTLNLYFRLAKSPARTGYLIFSNATKINVEWRKYNDTDNSMFGRLWFGNETPGAITPETANTKLLWQFYGYNDGNIKFSELDNTYPQCTEKDRASMAEFAEEMRIISISNNMTNEIFGILDEMLEQIPDSSNFSFSIRITEVRVKIKEISAGDILARKVLEAGKDLTSLIDTLTAQSDIKIGEYTKRAKKDSLIFEKTLIEGMVAYLVFEPKSRLNIIWYQYQNEKNWHEQVWFGNDDPGYWTDTDKVWKWHNTELTESPDLWPEEYEALEKLLPELGKIKK